MIRFIAAILGCLVVAGCVAPTKQVTAKFDDDDFKAAAGGGLTTVTGQAFLRQQGGGVVTCAGQSAMLLPVTPFTSNIVQIYRQGAKPDMAGITANGDYSHRAVRKTVCDAQGNFVFKDLPSGAWYALADVTWAVGYAPQGGSLIKDIATDGKSPLTVLLTDSDLAGRRAGF